MAGHDATLVCREKTAALINSEGTIVRLKLRDEAEHRELRSGDLPGKVNAQTPENARPEDHDIVCLAMQEPQYSDATVRELMTRVAASGKPCLSIMNMPPLPFLQRIEQLRDAPLEPCYDDPSVWHGFTPGLMSLCSPDPQAFRPPDEAANVLHVGLATNFKAVEFADPDANAMLRQLEHDIEQVRLDGKDVPVKLRMFESLFVAMAKWSMLLTGNYRCVLPDGEQSIKDAVHGDLDISRDLYAWVDDVVRRLGADPADQVPFDKYAKAAESLLNPSSAARAIAAGATKIERVDRMVQLIGARVGMQNDTVDRIVAAVDARLAANGQMAAR
jgi:hypothetical protein